MSKKEVVEELVDDVPVRDDEHVSVEDIQAYGPCHYGLKRDEAVSSLIHEFFSISAAGASLMGAAYQAVMSENMQSLAQTVPHVAAIGLSFPIITGLNMVRKSAKRDLHRIDAANRHYDKYKDPAIYEQCGFAKVGIGPKDAADERCVDPTSIVEGDFKLKTIPTKQDIEKAQTLMKSDRAQSSVAHRVWAGVSHFVKDIVDVKTLDYSLSLHKGYRNVSEQSKLGMKSLADSFNRVVWRLNYEVPVKTYNALNPHKPIPYVNPFDKKTVSNDNNYARHIERERKALKEQVVTMGLTGYTLVAEPGFFTIECYEGGAKIAHGISNKDLGTSLMGLWHIACGISALPPMKVAADDNEMAWHNYNSQYADSIRERLKGTPEPVA